MVIVQSPPKRIVRVITRLHVSGSALQVILLAHALREHGYETLLITGNTPPEDAMFDVAESYGVKVITLDDLTRTFNPLRLMRATLRLYRLIKDYSPQIVHTHTTTAGFLGRVMARLAGVPVVVHTLHTHPFRGYYNRLQTLIFVLLERLGSRLSDSIITLGEKLRRELVDRHHIAPKSAVTVLPLGFDLEEFAHHPRHSGAGRIAWDIPKDAPLVGIVGRLIPVKNHTLFLESAKLIHDKIPNVHFLIVGDGELRPTLEAQAHTLGLEGVVHFAGWQKNMASLYSEVDVLALSSWNEGTPVPIIEALVAGCAVVSTDVGGVSDLLDGGAFGVLVPPDNAPALADAIQASLHSPVTPREAREAMLSRYSITRLAQDMDSLYRGLILRKQTPPQRRKR